MAGRRAHAGNLEGQFVGEAIKPVLAWFVGLDDVVRFVFSMLSGVAIGTGITTSDMATDSATAQVHPPSIVGHTFDAARSRGLRILNFTEVPATKVHANSALTVG
jgi:hypothetical protein